MNLKEFRKLCYDCSKQDYIINPNFYVSSVDVFDVLSDFLGMTTYDLIGSTNGRSDIMIHKLISFFYSKNTVFMTTGSQDQVNAIMLEDLINTTSYSRQFKLWLFKKSRRLRKLILI